MGALLEVGTGFHHELTGPRERLSERRGPGTVARAVQRRFDEIIEFAGTERFVDTPLKRYSSGMQLRLAFAVAAHLEPEILIVDEILAVGDAEFQRRCLGRMTELTQEGRTVIFVTHDHGTMARLVSRVIWLERGQIVADGATADVLQRYGAATAPPKGERRVVLPRPGRSASRRRRLCGGDDGAGEPQPGRPAADHGAIHAGRPGARAGRRLLPQDAARRLGRERGAGPTTWRRPFPAGRAGTYTMVVEIPPVLPAGEYVLALWFGSYYEELVDEDVLSFEIAPSQRMRPRASPGRGSCRGRWRGAGGGRRPRMSAPNALRRAVLRIQAAIAAPRALDSWMFVHERDRRADRGKSAPLEAVVVR